jgi:cyclohexanone monooxygenase
MPYLCACRWFCSYGCHHELCRNSPEGIVSLGKEFALDCIVFATGFETGWITPGSDTSLTKRKTAAHGFQVYGRGGKNLSEIWEGGPRTVRCFSL